MKPSSASSQPTTESQRVAFLDGLRGIAALAVVFYHYLAYWPQKTELLGYPGDLKPFFDGGNAGVQLFFMISGFVIFMTLEKCSKLTEFWARRWIRLFPAMLAATMLLLIFGNLLPNYPGPAKLSDALPGLIFTPPPVLETLFGYTSESLDSAFWTLYVEAQFYILAGGFYFIFKGKTLEALFATAIGLKVLGYCFPAAMTEYGSFLFNVQSIFAHLPWFLVGMAFYKFSQDRTKRWNLVFLLLTFALILLQGGFMRHLAMRLVLLALFSAAFFVPLAARVLSARPLLFLGFISYPLYLTHQNLGIGLMIATPLPLDGAWSYLKPIGMIILAIALAYAIAKGIEAPAQKFLKEKLLRRR